ncbi:MAG: hypothetical protein ABWJ42_01795 [Sulfolobales archaeon]
MAVRIRIKIRSRRSGSEREVSALVNSGFETERPQILVPVALARDLGLWPPPPDSYLVELATAGGPVRNYLAPDSLEIYAVTRDRVKGPVLCDAILSHLEEEVVINDKLGEELGIVIIGLGSGK